MEKNWLQAGDKICVEWEHFDNLIGKIVDIHSQGDIWKCHIKDIEGKIHLIMHYCCMSRGKSLLSCSANISGD